ncbi:hypothetical protein GUI12_02420 [Anaplasmataceae bacterium AB001_6]|nr:hypothetical protein GUI12_02420 [Anaplasmataceae bacterium AB001_6]
MTSITRIGTEPSKLMKNYHEKRQLQEDAISRTASGKKFVGISEGISYRYQSSITENYIGRAENAITSNSQASDFMSSAIYTMEEGLNVLKTQFDSAAQALSGTVTDDMRVSLNSNFQDGKDLMVNIATTKYGNIPMLDGSNEEKTILSTVKGQNKAVELNSIDSYQSYNTITDNPIIQKGTNFQVVDDIGNKHATSGSVILNDGDVITVNGKNFTYIAASDTVSNFVKTMNSDAKVHESGIVFHVNSDGTSFTGTSVNAGTNGNLKSFTAASSVKTLSGGTNYRSADAATKFNEIYGEVQNFTSTIDIDPDLGRYVTFSVNIGDNTFASERLYLYEDANTASFDGKGNLLKSGTTVTLKGNGYGFEDNSIGLQFTTSSDSVIVLNGTNESELLSSLSVKTQQTNEIIEACNMKIGSVGTTTTTNDYGLNSISQLDTKGEVHKFDNGTDTLSISGVSITNDVQTGYASGMLSFTDTVLQAAATTPVILKIGSITVNSQTDLGFADLATVSASNFTAKLAQYLQSFSSGEAANYIYSQKSFTSDISGSMLPYSGLIMQSKAIGEEYGNINVAVNGTIMLLNAQVLDGSSAEASAKLSSGGGIVSSGSTTTVKSTDFVDSSTTVTAQNVTSVSQYFDVTTAITAAPADGAQLMSIKMADGSTKAVMVAEDASITPDYEISGDTIKFKAAPAVDAILAAAINEYLNTLDGVKSYIGTAATTDLHLLLSSTISIAIESDPTAPSGFDTTVAGASIKSENDGVYATKSIIDLSTLPSYASGDSLSFAVTDCYGNAMGSFKVTLGNATGAAPTYSGTASSADPVYGIPSGGTVDSEAATKTMFDTIFANEAMFAGLTTAVNGTNLEIINTSTYDFSITTSTTPAGPLGGTRIIAAFSDTALNKTFVPEKSESEIKTPTEYNSSILGDIVSLNVVEDGPTLKLTMNLLNRGDDVKKYPFYTFNAEIVAVSTDSTYGGMITKNTDIKFVSQDGEVGANVTILTDFDLSSQTESGYKEKVALFSAALNETLKDITFTQKRAIYNLEDENMSATVLNGIRKEDIFLQSNTFAETDCSAFTVSFDNGTPVIFTEINGERFSNDLSTDHSGIFDQTTNTLIVGINKDIVLESAKGDKIIIGLDGVKSDISLNNTKDASNLQDALNTLLGSNGSGGVEFLTGMDAKTDIVKISLPSMLPNSIYIDENGNDVSQTINVSTQEDAKFALEVINISINKLESQVSGLRAKSSKFAQQESLLKNTRANLISTRSTLEDIDMADAMTEVTTATLSADAADQGLSQYLLIQQKSVANILQTIARVTS